MLRSRLAEVPGQAVNQGSLPNAQDMRKFLLGLLAALTLPCWSAPTYTEELKSPVYRIDKIYKSMQGPSAVQTFRLGKTKKRELYWITGYEAVVVEPRTGKEISQEFLCHSNLDYRVDDYKKTIGDHRLDGRFFTLSQGQQKVTFPEGFGLPIFSDEELILGTQVLNLNDPKLNKKVRYRVRVEYQKDSERETPMKALRQIGVFGMKVIGTDETCAIPGNDHGNTCAVGEAAMPETEDMTGTGPKLTGHWIVAPGREVNRTDITPYLDLSEDLNVHYVAVHLHPYSESLELKDMTTGEVVFKANVKLASGRIGIDHIDHFSSAEGFTLKKGHRYYLTSIYNNTTKENVDSMAVMYVYGAVEKPPATASKR